MPLPEAEIHDLSPVGRHLAQGMISAPFSIRILALCGRNTKANWEKFFLWVTLPDGIGTVALLPKVLERKVAFVLGGPFYVSSSNNGTMRLNYTNTDPETINKGIRRLGELLKEAYCQ